MRLKAIEMKEVEADVPENKLRIVRLCWYQEEVALIFRPSLYRKVGIHCTRKLEFKVIIWGFLENHKDIWVYY